MICQICNKNPAVIHIQEIVNGEKKSLHICADCAAKKSEGNPVLQGFNITDILMNLGQQNNPTQSESDDPQEQPVSIAKCPFCGWDSDKLRKTGRMGCAECYSTFSGVIEGILTNMHRGIVHKGKIPALRKTQEDKNKASIDESHGEEIRADFPVAENLGEQIKELQLELEERIRNEEYEIAAQLRDRITGLKTQMKSAEEGGTVK